MQQFFMVIHVLTALAVIGLVLIQHGRGADAGAAFGSGASGTLFGSRGPATFLARITTILAATFFLTSISLAYLGIHSVKRESVIEKLRDDAQPTTLPQKEELSIPPLPQNLEPAAPEPAAVDIPESQSNKLEENVATPSEPATEPKPSLATNPEPSIEEPESSPIQQKNSVE